MKGDAFLKQPLYDSAYRAYQSSLEEYRVQKNTLGMIECLNKLALIDNIFTRTTRALEYLRESSALLSMSPELKKQLAICEEQQGRSYEDLGDIEESGKHVKKALDLRLELYGENDARTAYSFMNLARYHSFKKANDSSFYYSQKAYSICKKHPEHLHEIRYPELLLQHAYDSKNGQFVPDELRETHFRRIRKLYRQALDEARRRYSMPSAEEAAAYQGLANTYNDQVSFLFSINRTQGQACFDSARTYYDRSITIKRRLYGDYHRSVSVSYYTKGLIYGIHPDLDKKVQAFEVYQQAIQAVVPGYTPSGQFNLPIGLKSSHPYQLSVVLKEIFLLLRKLHKATGRNEYLYHAHAFATYRLEVWDEVVKRFESRESGSTIWIWGRTPFEDAVMAAFDMFQLTHDSLYLEEVFSFAERGRNNDFNEQALRSGTSNRRKQKDDRIDAFNTTCISRDRFVKNVLDSGDAYICFIPNNESEMERDFIVMVTKSRFEVRELRPALIDSLVNELENAIQSMSLDVYTTTAHRLYTEVLSSVLKPLSGTIDRLIISTDGFYARIPFEALLNKASEKTERDFRKLPYLLRQYKIQYALSASHLGRVSGKALSEKVSLSIHVPSFHNKSSLLFSERSANRLSTIYKGDFFSRSSATTTAFLNAITQDGVIQLSTHAEADLDEPGKSVLLFSGEQQEDTLFLSEVLGMKLDNPLTVISACETGLGKSVYAEGSKSFARAFAFAGSRSVLSTLWRVDDKASSTIIEIFYKNLSSGTNKPAALRQAKLDYISNSKTSEAASPFYWAGLVLSGDPRPLKLEVKSAWTSTLPYLKVGLVVLIITAWVWGSRKSSLKKAT